MLLPLRAPALLLLLLLSQGALRSLPAQDYTIFDLNGKYDEDPGSYYLRVRFNFVDQHADSEATAWWAVGGFDLAEEAAMGLRNLNQAFGPTVFTFWQMLPRRTAARQLITTPTLACTTPPGSRSSTSCGRIISPRRRPPGL